MHLQESTISKKTSDQLSKDGWAFDWSLNASINSRKIVLDIDHSIEGIVEFERDYPSLYNNVYTIEIAPWNRGKNKKYADVAGTLLAYVAKDSFVAGFDGFIALISKTNLAEHYIKRYGAQRISNSDRLVFETEASRKLINDYLEEKDVTYETIKP
jgi:hypothetical protein